MSQSNTTLVSQLIDIVGAGAVTCAEDVTPAQTIDWWPIDKLALEQGILKSEVPLCIVRPTCTEQVSAVVKLVAEAGARLVPYGGGSGVTGGARALSGAIVLNTQSLAGEPALDADNLTVTVPASILLGDLERFLQQRGFTTGHYPQSIDLAAVGGLMATRSAGQFSNKYGNIEEVALACTVVLADGRVVSVDNSPRRATGPDLMALVLGSEGTLGVITEAKLRVHRLPETRWMETYFFADWAAGVSALRRVFQSGVAPAVTRLYDSIETPMHVVGVEAPDGHVGLLVLCEGPAGVVAAERAIVDQSLRTSGGLAVGAGPVQHWLEVRNNTSYFERSFAEGAIIDTIEIAAEWTKLAPLYDRVLELCRALPQLERVSGHVSHCYSTGANIYFSVRATWDHQCDPRAAYDAMWDAVLAGTLESGGIVSHHHGMGRVRAPWTKRDLGSAFDLLVAVKSALDPQRILNPGTLLPEDV